MQKVVFIDWTFSTYPGHGGWVDRHERIDNLIREGWKVVQVSHTSCVADKSARNYSAVFVLEK